MDPITATLLLGGTGLNLFGGIIGQNDALANATAQANARNAVVRSAINQLDQYGAQNRGTFNDLMAGYSPTNQATTLAADQAKRSDSNVNAITTENPNATPIQADASPATRSDLAKRMLAVHDMAVDRAKAQGQLGGYSDAWLTNELNNAQAGRDIGVINNFAEGRKALVQPESDLAAAAAYRPPSIWGPLLSGLGSIAVGFGGRSLGGFDYGGANLAAFDPTGELTGQDLHEAELAGRASGLISNPFTGTVF
jgi:hypothetical protein